MERMFQEIVPGKIKGKKMEEVGGQGLIIGAVTVVGSDAPSDYHVAPRTDSATAAVVVALPKSELVLSSSSSPPMMMIMNKKKRGRPRKYGPDGTPTPLSPKPISSSAPPPFNHHHHAQLQPPFIDFSGKIRSLTKIPKMCRRVEAQSSGEMVGCSVGTNFRPHMLAVNIGEDVTMKVISFAQQGHQAICILSASGLISSVTFRQPDSCGGTITYEGRFEILSLAGSFMSSDVGGTRSRAGGMSISLACPDGRIMGGAIAGLLVAASPVQLVVASFLTGNQKEHRNTSTKQIPEFNAATTAAVPISIITKDEAYNSTTQEQRIPISTKQVLTCTPAPFRCDTWPSVAADIRSNSTDINLHLHG